LLARILLDLQTLVSRETDPTDPAVFTVGPIQGDGKHNIIANAVHLKLPVRTTKNSVRKHRIASVGKSVSLRKRPGPIVDRFHQESVRRQGVIDTDKEYVPTILRGNPNEEPEVNLIFLFIFLSKSRITLRYLYVNATATAVAIRRVRHASCSL
jgi:hypothetical protein